MLKIKTEAGHGNGGTINKQVYENNKIVVQQSSISTGSNRPENVNT